MIILRESYSIIKLCKFIAVLIPRAEESASEDKFYYNDLPGYFYLWEYDFNLITGEENDFLEHSMLIDSLPFELQKPFKKGYGVWGTVDYYSWANSTRLFVSDPIHRRLLTRKGRAFIQKMVQPYILNNISILNQE